ncbi:MAG: polyprenyl synthetase family protein [Actinomycetota bacterium]
MRPDDPVGTILAPIRARVDAALAAYLAERREALAALDASAAVLVDELRRLLDAGGKRLRPAFCILGFRAAGGDPTSEAIWGPAAALELFHAFALVHDDVIDGAATRRGVPTTAAAFGGGERGRAAAILVGDLGAELAGALLRRAPFPPERVSAALARYDAMVLALAAGQFLDATADVPADLEGSLRIARLKSSAYTVEAPLAIGAAFAGARPDVHATLAAFARPYGEAFQLRDDLEDGDAAAGVTPADVDARVDAAVAAIGDRLEPTAADGLRAIAEGLRMGA